MRFSATVILGGKTATGIEVPASVVEALGSGKRPAVHATVEGYTYRTTVAPMSDSYWIPLAAETPAAVMDAAPGARAAFHALSYSNQRRHVLSVDGAKTAETRQRRIGKAVAELTG